METPIYVVGFTNQQKYLGGPPCVKKHLRPPMESGTLVGAKHGWSTTWFIYSTWWLSSSQLVKYNHHLVCLFGWAHWPTHTPWGSMAPFRDEILGRQRCCSSFRPTPAAGAPGGIIHQSTSRATGQCWNQGGAEKTSKYWTEYGWIKKELSDLTIAETL